MRQGKGMDQGRAADLAKLTIEEGGDNGMEMGIMG